MIEYILIPPLNNDLSVTYENINAGQSSGVIRLFRYGKLRQLVFGDVKAQSGQTVLSMPTLAQKDWPILSTESFLIRGADNAFSPIWINTNGTFGGPSIDTRVLNGSLIWFVA